MKAWRRFNLSQFDTERMSRVEYAIPLEDHMVYIYTDGSKVHDYTVKPNVGTHEFYDSSRYFNDSPIWDSIELTEEEVFEMIL